jgi:hypothetical protein
LGKKGKQKNNKTNDNFMNKETESEDGGEYLGLGGVEDEPLGGRGQWKQVAVEH